MLPSEQHDAVVARDLARQEQVEVVLQRRHGPRELLEALERQRADLGVLEGDRLAAVAVGADAVEADDVAQHVVAGRPARGRPRASTVVLSDPSRIAYSAANGSPAR